MSEAPERIWMDPDIKFPECDKQYGSDVEYVRADRIEELKAKLAKAVDFIQDLTGCEWPYDEDAKRILAEITGGKDE